MIRLRHWGWMLCAIALPLAAQADSCLPFLQLGPFGRVTVLTINKNLVASFGVCPLSLVKAGPTPAGGVHPAYYKCSLPTYQLFSDRNHGIQPFDTNQADRTDVEITVADSPTVTLTLQSWNNGKAIFTATCSATGYLHASTPDVEYLMQVTPVQ